MSLYAALVERARAVRIEDEIARRGFKLRRQGAELVGPCPCCGGTDRFGIHLRKQLFNCRGCGARGGDAIALVRHFDACSFVEAIETLTGDRAAIRTAPSDLSRRHDKPQKPDADEIEQHRKAAWLWSQRKPITDSIAAKYLREVRAITCELPATLGFLAATDKHPPALIAAFAIPDEPEPSMLGTPRNVDAIHLTLLKPDGSGKADIERPKLMVGSPGVRPIVLAPPDDLLGLAITEGIEDALTVHQATGLGAWAAGAAGRMPGLADMIPDFIECVTIYAHTDERGRKGGKALAVALNKRGIEVTIEGLT